MAMKIDNIVKNAISGVQSSLTEARKTSSQLALGTGGSSEQPEADTSSSSDVPKVVKSSDPDLGNIVDVEA
ncbi:MAG: hypothetical protein OQK73_08305 [Gammaproteobacteria bacterium]|nr:hypothetical protein [Gammaproteobacteria bacterium]